MAGAVMALALASCSAVNQELNAKIVYKPEMFMEINGKEFRGTAVPDRAESYKVKIVARGKINMFLATTCHEEIKQEFDPGFFEKGNKHEFTYTPVKELEDGETCMMTLATYEKDKGRHEWGAIDFQNGTENVSATLLCDGYKVLTKPVSICRAHEGLMQRIVFDREMVVKHDEPHCAVMKSKDMKTFDWIMPKGECTYYFGDENDNFHRLSTIGYDGHLLREM
jgi:hypothetical protein